LTASQCLCFFFSSRRRHTRFDCDWSSDVCSSDLNDTHGHAAGDACLQHFTLMAQTRLRPGDMLARTGGDEFCIVLPSSTLREGAMIARRVVDVCRDDAAAAAGNDIAIAVSIGVAQWSREMGQFPDRLIAHADHALYAAK